MNLRIPTLAALAVVQVLATSCGGGGGGGGGDTALANSIRIALDNNQNAGTATATKNLAGAESKQRSVTQSSETLSFVSQSSVSDDNVEVIGLGDAPSSLASVTIAVTNSTSADILRLDADNADVVGNSATLITINGVQLSAAAISVSFGDDLPENTDWAAIGIWIHADLTSTVATDWNLGVFAATSNPTGDLGTVTGSFTYLGTSEGYMVVLYDKDDDNVENDEYDFIAFSAEAQLNADFASDTINGLIANVHDFSNDEDALDYIVELQEVTLSNDNFFNGEVRVRALSPLGLPTVHEHGTGKWGGQFFGAGAEGVLGTYGGSLGESDDAFLKDIAPGSDLAEVWFAGAFIATQEEAP